MNLAGAWRLKSFEVVSPTGERNLWGKGAHGLLIYTSNGFMSVAINCDIEEEGEDIEWEQLFNSFLFYSGKYELKKNGKQVTHLVLNATDPDRMGEAMVREVALDGDELTLIGRAEFGVATVVWERTGEIL